MRERLKRNAEPLNDHMRTLTEAKEIELTGFFCTACDEDFDAYGKKQVRYSGVWPIAWYGALCRNGHVCLRYITDKYKDPYYMQSKVVAEERRRYADDMLSPDDPRFKLVYPDKWRELEEARQERQRYAEENR